MKTQGSLPSEDATLVLLFGLIATGQIKLRKIDGYKKLAGAPQTGPAWSLTAAPSRAWC